jgi:protein associated with RNAse G/E
MHTVAPPSYGAGQFCEERWFKLIDAVRSEEIYMFINMLNMIVIESDAFYKLSKSTKVLLCAASDLSLLVDSTRPYCTRYFCTA